MIYTTRKKTWISALLIIGNLAASVLAVAISSHSNHELTGDDLILFGHESELEIVSREKYMNQIKSVTIATESEHAVNYADTKSGNEHSSTIQKRCKEHTVWTMKPTQTFVGNDVLMSNIILAPPNQTVVVFVEEGHWLEESLSLSIAENIFKIKKFLSFSVQRNFDWSWTTTKSSRYSFKIPPGKFGAVVSNPLTTRYSGYMDSGCIGNMERTEFSGESYQSRSHFDLNWVEGVIGLCVGDTYPLPMCIGNGTLSS